MKKIAAVLAVLIALAGPVSSEETPSREVRRKRLIELMNLLDQGKLFRSQFRAMLDEQKKSYASQYTPPEGISAEAAQAQREEFEKKGSAYIDRYETLFFQKLDLKELEEQVYIPLYEKYFSDDEIKDLLTFYRTPTGAKSLEVLPGLSAEALQRAGAIIGPVIAAVMAELQKEDEDSHPWRKTMADIRTMATAIEAYATDNDLYPAVSSTEQYKSALSPTYINKVPEKDSWGSAYVIVVSPDQKHYRIVSAGSDGILDWDSRHIKTEESDSEPLARLTTNAAEDIIYQDGTFLQYPMEADSD